jgi:gamma-glutamylcyclotransferase
LYYFAYGSNMNWQQMKRRCPSSRFVCVARLPGYRFAIARHSQLRNCGTANILVEHESEVWGIVYDLNDVDLRRLDGFEDGYRREKVHVYAIGDGNHPLEAVVYIAPREDEAPLPNREYKRLIVQGAKYWKLPAAYAAMLENIEIG